jgi:hypothetical protein
MRHVVGCKVDALRTVVARPGRRRVIFCSQTAAALLGASLTLAAWATHAAAQVQSDHLGQQLGTAPKAAPASPAGKSIANEPLRLPVTVRAGQSVVLRAGAATFTADRQSAPLSFRTVQKPACGEVLDTANGIILKATADCVGQVLKFDYDVAVTDALPAEKRAVRVAVEAVVQSGIESCGIANAPYAFIRVPGGSYPLQNLPPQVGDIAALSGSASATVEPFCISEEAVPASEMEAFLAVQTASEKQTSFPEVLVAAPQPFTQFEMGRSGRPPALAVSYRMAQAYARRQSAAMDRQLRLPRLEQYIAAAVYLQRQQPDAPATQSFLVSLRGGLLEWTETPCNTIGTFVVLGVKQQSGLLDKYCYDASQALARMGFRLVSATARNVDAH